MLSNPHEASSRNCFSDGTDRLRSPAIGVVRVAVARNGAAFSGETELTTNLPTANLLPAFLVTACDGTSRTLHADFFAFRRKELAR